MLLGDTSFYVRFIRLSPFGCINSSRELHNRMRTTE